MTLKQISRNGGTMGTVGGRGNRVRGGGGGGKRETGGEAIRTGVNN